MRTLVLSDIHGNIDALKAINETFDDVICIGDTVDYGPDPVACIDFLRELKVFRSRGNHDDAVAFRRDCHTPFGPYRHLSLASRKYTQQALGNKERLWLGEPEIGVWAENDGYRIFGCHGAPSNRMYKYLVPSTPDEELIKEVASVDADIIITGHTHKPFVKHFDGKTLVNVGSVGQPRDGNPQACYAIIEGGDVQIKRTWYDLELVVHKIRGLGFDETVTDQLVYLLENAAPPPLQPLRAS